MKTYKEFITEKSLNVVDIPANVRFDVVSKEAKLLMNMIIAKAKKNKKDERALGDIEKDIEDAQKAFKK